MICVPKKKLTRRHFLRFAIGTGMLPPISQFAGAQAYPSRPARLVAGAAAGGSFDKVAQIIAQRLTERLGQPFTVENQPGQRTIKATETVARAAADGHTLLLVNVATAVNPSLYNNLNYDFERDLAPVASLTREACVFAVNPAFPAKTLDEFIAFARRIPESITIGSPGNATIAHLAGEWLKLRTGVNVVHAQYKGGRAMLSDALNGKLPAMVGTIGGPLEHIKAGRLHALAVTTSQRLRELPDVPAISEFIPGYEASVWTGIAVPRSTSPGIIKRLHAEINAALDDAQIQLQFSVLAGSAFALASPAEFETLIAADTRKWSVVIRAAGITP
jgi:tripartite-type tricarboxylate transporter receptor subunit TctC